MSEQFHSLKIHKTVKETSDATSIYLEIPADLKNDYAYIPGQYLTFEAEINGENVRRAYSLCTSPFTDEVPAITVKKVENGRMSNYLNNEVAAGQEIKVGIITDSENQLSVSNLKYALRLL